MSSPLARQLFALAQSVDQHALGDVFDQAGLFRERDEPVRADAPELGVVPADERFDGVCAAVVAAAPSVGSARRARRKSMPRRSWAASARRPTL